MSEQTPIVVNKSIKSKAVSILAEPAYSVMEMIKEGLIDKDELFKTQIVYANKIDKYVKAFYEIAGGACDGCSNANDDDREFGDQVDDSANECRSALRNIPVSIKDIFNVRGFCATAGSKILEGYRPPYDSTVAARSKALGNRVVGKTSLDEFAMGSSNETSAYGPCFNPWDLGRVPGGSSGGGAVSVASCQSFVGWGTDTGGSVRQPAALCGVVGFKPSYGLVSRFGLIAYASSLDTPSTFTRNALDAALAMNAVCYPDRYDATVCVPEPLPDFVSESDPVTVANPRFAIVKELVSEELLDKRVAARFYATVDALKRAGAVVEEVNFPLANLTLPAYYIITTAECSSNLARFDGIRYGAASDASIGLLEMYFNRRGGMNGFGAETKRRILLGTYVLSSGYFDAYYNKARALRRAITGEVAKLMLTYDALILPTSPDPAFKFGERMDDPVKMYMSDIATVIANLAGTCAISLPCGSVPDNDSSLSVMAHKYGITDEMQAFCKDDSATINLPVGFQMIGKRYSDVELLKNARWYEQVTGYSYEMPPLIARMLDD